MSFEVIVLAAGRGSRLGGLGESTPKWLLEVGGSTIAERQLAAIEQASAEAPGRRSGVTVVTGHAASLIDEFLAGRDGAVRTLFNPDYARLNNWYSVLHALRNRQERGAGVIVVNADLFADAGWLSSFFVAALTTESPSLIAIDLERELTDESMKVSADGEAPGGAALRKIGKVGVDHPVGEYVGLLMARDHVLRDFTAALESFEGRPDAADAWYERAVGETAAAGADWRIWPTPSSRWVEIDDDDDHALAVAMESGA